MDRQGFRSVHCPYDAFLGNTIMLLQWLSPPNKCLCWCDEGYSLIKKKGYIDPVDIHLNHLISPIKCIIYAVLFPISYRKSRCFRNPHKGANTPLPHPPESSIGIIFFPSTSMMVTRPSHSCPLPGSFGA